ncbi:hypothetical protein BD410DRAFT_404606 [Rickenella mellea]|uniref:DUF6535 domain-containing protein n=1 Tax=Rickenella mellea TaxID=50990 RepID=A0A4Y7PYS5_9AGAM|nr:hypothetical protein BD410DRAFT_404606 [Rickenella mellea]
MASLLRRRDEHDQLNDVSADVECGAEKTNEEGMPGNPSLEERGAKIWGPYLVLSDKFDKDLVHNWRDDMDSLLIFAALFSASVTAFVIESYKNLSQDPSEVTVSVLLQISRQLANGTHTPVAVLPPFSPRSTDVAVNVFWFLSLAFSLACALAAVLVRQWARQYLRFPRSFSSTTEQARARQYVYENVQWWKMELIVEMIPALLRISLILFFIGLLLFTRYINFTLAVYLLCFSSIGGAAYATLTIAPLIFPACPYKTPFSAIVSLCTRLSAYFFLAVARRISMLSGLLKGSLTSVLSMSRRFVHNLPPPTIQNQWSGTETVRHNHSVPWADTREVGPPRQITAFEYRHIAESFRLSLRSFYRKCSSLRNSATSSLKLSCDVYARP